MKPSRKVQRGFSVHPDWTAALKNVHVVLVGTTHPGNIGAVARVMKNMALRNLTLVSSTNCDPDTEARSMASGAYEIVEQARNVSNVADALGPCQIAVATSGRLGGKRPDAQVPDRMIPLLMENAFSGPVAVVFGRESSGLTNEEMKLCTHHMIIPTDSDFASMNLAQAVGIAAYEIFKIACKPSGFQAREVRGASVEKREQMYDHVEKVLLRAGFLDQHNPLVMMRDVRRIFNNAVLDDRDVAIVRGIFRKMDNMIRIADEKIALLEDKKHET
jgi:TrmH family RNA methyltransferase